MPSRSKTARSPTPAASSRVTATLVLIRHPNGFVSAYANNGELNVKRGDVVKRGQVIAKSGESGNVSGAATALRAARQVRRAGRSDELPRRDMRTSSLSSPN